MASGRERVDHLARIDDMLGHGVELEEIEDYLDHRRELDEDGRAALWLYAWVESDCEEHRRTVADPLLRAAGRRRGTPGVATPGPSKRRQRRLFEAVAQLVTGAGPTVQKHCEELARDRLHR
jgi:DNA-binding transcriptional MerR regulator